MLELDHLAVSAADLAVGTARIEDLFGVRLAPGGKHPDMGTHNRLLSLGPGLYLEVIAIDAAAPPPDRPRWFDLDNFDGPPARGKPKRFNNLEFGDLNKLKEDLKKQLHTAN